MKTKALTDHNYKNVRNKTKWELKKAVKQYERRLAKKAKKKSKHFTDPLIAKLNCNQESQLWRLTTKAHNGR